MSDLRDPKAALLRYLQDARDALLWKLEGLGERDLRLPRTPTGTNLLGIVRHVANVEIGYFGPTFGREWPDPDHPLFVSDPDYDADPQADWWVPASVPAAEVVDFYRSVWAFSDATVAELPLDAAGAVPWWSAAHRDVTLHRVLVHVLADTHPARRPRRHPARGHRRGCRPHGGRHQHARGRLAGVRHPVEERRRGVPTRGCSSPEVVGPCTA